VAGSERAEIIAISNDRPAQRDALQTTSTMVARARCGTREKIAVRSRLTRVLRSESCAIRRQLLRNLDRTATFR
jgi:hypothetical protein